MRRALCFIALAALTTPGPAARGQDRAQDLSAVVIPLATRESAAYVKAFNERNSKALATLFTSDSSVAFLEGESIEKLQYGMAAGKDVIVSSHEVFFSSYPGAKLTETVLSARLIRPDVLIADVDFEIKGMPGDAGPILGRSVVVRVLESGAWKISAGRSFAREPGGKISATPSPRPRAGKP